MNEYEKLIGLISLISMKARTIHYTTRGDSFLSNHEFAGKIMEKYIGLLDGIFEAFLMPQKIHIPNEIERMDIMRELINQGYNGTESTFNSLFNLMKLTHEFIENNTGMRHLFGNRTSNAILDNLALNLSIDIGFLVNMMDKSDSSISVNIGGLNAD